MKNKKNTSTSSTARDRLIQGKNTEMVQLNRISGGKFFIERTIQESKIDDNQLSSPQVLSEKKPENFNNFWDFFKIAIILSISSLEVGYALAQIAIIPVDVIIESYKIPLSGSLTHALLMGVWPVGGIAGAIINWNLLKIWKKRRIYYLIGVLNLLLTGLMQITTFQTLLIGRFILGINCGMYPMMAPVMTKQLIPTSLLPLMGCFFSLGRTIGLVVCFSVGVIFQVTIVNQYWRIIFIIPGIIGIIQTITVMLFVPDSPSELIQRGQSEALQKMITKYYKEEYVESIIQQYHIIYEMQKAKADGSKQENDPYKSNKLRAFLMAIHVNVYSNLCGINTSFLLSSSLMDRLIPQFAVYANLTINSIRIPLNFLAAFWIVKKFGRRPLMVLSALLLAICNYSIAIGYLTDSIIQVIVINILFMVVFSILYNPVMFTYPAQIIPAGQYIVAYVFNQAAMALALFVPPLILTAMDGNGFALFIFFGVYSTLSVIYMYFYLKESKGIKYDQIIKTF